MSETAARHNAATWKNPYVTDGLVAMWDGEWNAGLRIHDSNATVWKDLSGNDFDLTFPGSGRFPAIWESDCATRNIAQGSYDPRYASNFAESSKGSPKLGAIEVVFQRSYYDSGYPKTIIQGQQGNAIRIFERSPSDCIVFGGFSNQNGFQVGNRNGLICFVALISDTEVTDYFIDGMRVADKDLVPVTTNWNGMTPYPFIVGGRRNTDNDQSFYGKIFRIGCYSMLNEQQIAANYAVDKKRFGI